MPKIATATFNGENGSYNFNVYDLNTNFKSIGAVYVFSKRIVSQDGRVNHTLLYIGQTESLSDRIPNHEKWTCVSRNGANCICVHLDDNEKSRLYKETDLRNAYDTPCNDQ